MTRRKTQPDAAPDAPETAAPAETADGPFAAAVEDFAGASQDAPEPVALSQLADATRAPADIPGKSAPVEQRTSGQMVRAKQFGIYGNVRRRVGDTFFIAAGEKRAKWMEPVSAADTE